MYLAFNVLGECYMYTYYPRASRSVQLGATAFDYEQFEHLPYMDISSSGESSFVVAVRACETRAAYCVSTRTRVRPAFPRAMRIRA